MRKDELRATFRVVRGGIFSSADGVNAPEVGLSALSVTDKDLRDFQAALELGVEHVGLSFVRGVEDVDGLGKAVGKVARQLAAAWGVEPVLSEGAGVSYEELPSVGKEASRGAGLGGRGEAVVITPGFPFHLSGSTNTMRVDEF